MKVPDMKFIMKGIKTLPSNKKASLKKNLYIEENKQNPFEQAKKEVEAIEISKEIDASFNIFPDEVT